VEVTDSGSGDASLADARATGSIHVAWVLKRADGTPTDCITASTNDIEVAVTSSSPVEAVSNTYYCVDMAETIGDLPPGDYAIELRLFDSSNRVTASATGAAKVSTAGVADAGTLTLVLSK
jgi:hypothetical protein